MTESMNLHRINGEMMNDNLAQAVGILGEVTEVDKSGSSFKMKTGDNVIISVYLEEPSQDYIGGFVEVIGKVTSKTTIICNSLVVFPPEHSSKFDINFYNIAVQLLHKNKDVPLGPLD